MYGRARRRQSRWTSLGMDCKCGSRGCKRAIGRKRAWLGCVRLGITSDSGMWANLPTGEDRPTGSRSGCEWPLFFFFTNFFLFFFGFLPSVSFPEQTLPRFECQAFICPPDRSLAGMWGNISGVVVCRYLLHVVRHRKQAESMMESCVHIYGRREGR